MTIIKKPGALLLTCCAVGVLAGANPVWAADIYNCAEVSATTEGDIDSSPNPTNSYDSAALQAAFTATPQTNQDDESCALVAVELIYDFGDAPDDIGGTATGYMTATSNHEIVPGLMLGAAVDEEAAGQPSADADGDGADEQGVVIPSMTDGQALTLAATVTNTTTRDAQLACWIDYNGDGVFATDTSEFGAVSVPAGTAAGTAFNVVMPQVPATATADTKGMSYARCRLTTDVLSLTSVAATGSLFDGEMEDYKVTFTAAPQFDLALRKTLAVGQATNVQVGDTVTYAIEVINQGGIEARAIQVIDYIPPGMELDDANWTANVDGTSATLNTPIASLATGATTAGTPAAVQITLKVKATAAKGVKNNKAEILAANDDKDVAAVDVDSVMDSDPNNDHLTDDVVDNSGTPADEDDHDVAQVTVDPTVDIKLTKTVDKSTARRGDTIVYTLTAVNNGPDAATGVVVTDKLPANLSYVSNDAAPGVFDATTGVWTIGGMEVDQPVVINITTTIK